MKDDVKIYIEKYSVEIRKLFCELRELIYDASSDKVEEMLWAKMPSYYVGDAFVRLILFKNHINVEAKCVMLHKEELAGYKITPKGMLQIPLMQEIPVEILKCIFAETLAGDFPKV